MAGSVERFIIGFGIFDVAAGRDAGFTTLTAQLVAMLFAIISFGAHCRGILQARREFRGGGVVADIAGGQDDFRRQSADRIDSEVELGVEPASGLSNRLILSTSWTIGMLMDFVMGAVVKHRLGFISADQALLQKTEEPGEGEPVEVLKDGPPFAEFGRQGPPCGTVEHHIPKGIEVFVHGGGPAACRHNVVVSNPEFLDLIF